VREPRKGALGRATGLAEGVAAAMRRRARDREPRVLLYDELGHSRGLPAEDEHRERILELGAELVALTAPRRAEPGPGDEPVVAEPEPGEEPVVAEPDLDTESGA
jgi:hypothetical protein